MKTLLTSKSVLDCKENELEKLHKEVEEIFYLIGRLPNYDCEAFSFIFKGEVEAHNSKQIFKLHDIEDYLEYSDFKNGADIYNLDDRLLFECYGDHDKKESIILKIYEGDKEINIFDRLNTKLITSYNEIQNEVNGISETITEVDQDLEK